MRLYSNIEHLLELTLAVYKVTAIFPKGEDGEELGSKIRELADKILADLLSEKTDENISRQIRELAEHLNEADRKNWVDPRNFLVLRREYEKFGRRGKTVDNPELNQSSVHGNHRQKKILEVINGNGMVRIGNLIKIFPGINRRTVLRDLDKLCQTGIMVRNGSGRGAYYAKNGSSVSS